jgi:DivIVA domain-containing protein
MANIDVDNARFSPVRLRAGYDMGEVDQHLDQVKVHLAALDAAVAGRGPAPDPLRPVRFTQVRLREGYDISEIDAFLAQVDAEDTRLRSLARSGISPAPSPATDPVVDPSAPAAVVDVSAPVGRVPSPGAGPATPDPVIREVGGRSTNLALAVLALAALIAIVLVALFGR